MKMFYSIFFQLLCLEPVFIRNLPYSSYFSPTWNLGLLLGRVRSQYLVMLLSLCWITGGHTIHPPVKGMLPPAGAEPTPSRKSTSKDAELQVHVATLSKTVQEFIETEPWLLLTFFLCLDNQYTYLP